MNGCLQACLATTLLLSFLVLVYMCVPTEQTLTASFPNVVILRGLGEEGLEPISFDNNTLPTLSAAEVATMNGLYQFDPLFYHKTLERFIPWEDRDKVTVWTCTMFCNAQNTSAEQVKLVLVHTTPAEKKNGAGLSLRVVSTATVA